MNRWSTNITRLALGLLLALPALRAQDTPVNPPTGSGESGSQGQGQSEQTTSGATPRIERTPVGGVTEDRVGGLSLGRSFLLPSFQIFENYDTNIENAGTTSSSRASSVTGLRGTLSLSLQRRRSSLMLDYATGGYLFNSNSSDNSFSQQLGLTDSLFFRRWSFLLGEHVSYLPQSAFGLGGLGIGTGGAQSLPNPGGTLNNFNPTFVPGQSLIGGGARLSSSTVAQGQYMIGPRSSFSVAGSFSLLHFLGPGFIDSHGESIQVGYDFNPGPRDTLTFGYSGSFFQVNAGQVHNGNHQIQLGYRRRISGRLSFVTGGGPVVNHFSNPVNGSGNRISWGLRSSLQYLTAEGTLAVLYSHRITEGSGLLLGADSDEVSLNYARNLSRVWNVLFDGGYAHNQSLQQTTPGLSSFHFNGWRGGVSVHRPVGRNSSLYVQYTLNRQTSNATLCGTSVTLVSCGTVALRQTIGLGFDWSTRPYAID